jgi:hypothetical protein
MMNTPDQVQSDNVDGILPCQIEAAGSIMDEYGFERTRNDLFGYQLGQAIQSIARQKVLWDAEFPEGLIEEANAQKWRKRTLPPDSTSTPRRFALLRRPSVITFSQDGWSHISINEHDPAHQHL